MFIWHPQKKEENFLKVIKFGKIILDYNKMDFFFWGKDHATFIYFMGVEK